MASTYSIRQHQQLELWNVEQLLADPYADDGRPLSVTAVRELEEARDRLRALLNNVNAKEGE